MIVKFDKRTQGMGVQIRKIKHASPLVNAATGQQNEVTLLHCTAPLYTLLSRNAGVWNCLDLARTGPLPIDFEYEFLT